MDGPNPQPFHAASVVLHVAAALLVFAIVRQLMPSDAAACAGALVFAVHPVQVESVAWASGAKDLLAGVSSLAVIDQFLRFSAKRQNGGVRYAAACFFLCSRSCWKPSAVVAAGHRGAARAGECSTSDAQARRLDRADAAVGRRVRHLVARCTGAV